MDLMEMGQTRARAWIVAVVWTLAGVGFAVTFVAGGGPGEFHVDSGRHLVGALALAFGFLGQWIALWVTRQRPGGPPLSDERDLRILARANQATLVVVLMAIFAFTIGLWVSYEAEGQVPVGWMWFLAYGSVILASLTSAIITLALEKETGRHG